MSKNQTATAMETATATMTAARQELGDVTSQIIELEKMTAGGLAEKYQELFGEPTHSRNKAYLKKRLAWRIQELCEGGLSKNALLRISQLGDELPESWRRGGTPQTTQQNAEDTIIKTTKPTLKAKSQRDPRLPPVGTILQRTFKGITHQVTVGADNFEYNGQIFKTLSAVAKHITGTPWNGFSFFGCGTEKRKNAKQESAA